jgi:hypothetical protein
MIASRMIRHWIRLISAFRRRAADVACQYNSIKSIIIDH